MSVSHTSTMPGTLKQVRDMFIKASGRYDLVNNDGSDYGANEYINMGARYLSERHPDPDTTSRARDIAAGTLRFTMEENKAITDVWVTNADGKSRLIRLSRRAFREKYATIYNDLDTTATPPIVQAALGTGRPYHYCIGDSGLPPQDNFPDSSTWAAGDDVTRDYEDITPGDYYDTKIIMLAPIPDEAYTLRVFGMFYPLKLEDDGDINYWTQQQPSLLVQAALYEMEKHQRNTAGQRDALFALQDGLLGLHYNATWEELAEIDRIDFVGEE